LAGATLALWLEGFVPLALPVATMKANLGERRSSHSSTAGLRCRSSASVGSMSFR